MIWQRFASVILLAALIALIGCGTGGGGAVVEPNPDDTTNGNGNTDSLRVEVPAGVFIRGSDLEAYGDENPAHYLDLDGFYISATEITNAQYSEFLNDGNSIYYHGEMAIRLVNGSYEPLEGYEDHPVVYVSWIDAVEYADWAGGRLPTEAEWEKAARGTDGRWYPWGDGIEIGYADFARTTDEYTLPVATYEQGVSPYGVYDMAGSVWEWCSDWYDYYYYSYCPDTNPQGPSGPMDYEVKVIRGGSFREGYMDVRTSRRYYSLPDDREFNLGFRVVWDE